jgi:hypothetical protein
MFDFLCRRSRDLRSEQRAATFESSAAVAVGKEIEVADADQTSGEDEPAHKFVRRYGHDLLLATEDQQVSPHNGIRAAEGYGTAPTLTALAFYRRKSGITAPIFPSGND